MSNNKMSAEEAVINIINERKAKEILIEHIPSDGELVDIKTRHYTLNGPLFKMIFAAMEEYASTRQGAGEWVKASDRLPEKKHNYHAKVHYEYDNGKPGVWNTASYWNGEHFEHPTEYESFTGMPKKIDPANIEWLDPSASSTGELRDGWTTEKPNKECVFVGANRYTRNDEDLEWDYSIWQIKKLDGEDEKGEYGWYYGLLNGDGEEWGDLDDLSLQKYLIITPPTP